MSIKQRQFEPASDDTVQCFLFSPTCEEESLKELCGKLNSVVEAVAANYIWHRDELRVYMPILSKSDKEIPLHLTSSTCFGDNIEDEWFIVYIMLELTKQFTDLIVQVKDNDGDFLLIEAANVLPQWANPDSTENRVFIYRNNIHIIPTNLASIDEDLKISDALQYVVQNENETVASQEIQQAILNRIGNYPEKHMENIHNAIVQLPLEIAVLLKMQPQLIAPIVNTYCHHDVMDIKSCKILDYQNIKTVSVKFTKYLYAMLLHAKNIKKIMSLSDKDKSLTLGKKITCGFQMIMNKSSDIFSKEYNKFIKSLSDNGYFKGNIEGSQEYQKLLNEANNFFSSVECPTTSSVGKIISEIINSDEFKEAKDLFLTPTSPNLVEDNEDWLKIHPNQLNDLLNSHYGNKNKFESKNIITPQNISSQLSDFLKTTSDYDGIETVDKDLQTGEIEFDPEQFVNSIDKMLKMLSCGEEQNDSDFSDDDDDYGETVTDDELDKELKVKLQGNDTNLKDNVSIFKNMISSMREEQASSGPSSNLMSTLGHMKSDFLDSDDED